MPDAPASEKIYNSTVRMKVDDKRRVQIPAKWRPDETGVELTLVPWETTHGTCLRVLPQSRYLKMIEKIEAMPEDSIERDELLRKVGSNSEQVTIDSAGRITIPDEMARQAGLHVEPGKPTEAMLVGVLRVFEIWNLERYASSKTASSLSPASYRLIS